MTLSGFAIVGLILMGILTSQPADPSTGEAVPAPVSSPAPQAQPVHLHAEMSGPMFHGTVHTIDRTTLRVTIRTDFGRVVPVTVVSCDMLQWLRIGDHVRLDVDAQGIVQVLEKTGAVLTTAPGAPAPRHGCPVVVRGPRHDTES